MNAKDVFFECRGKHPYPSYSAAKADIRVMREKFHERRLELYHCKACHQWHIGAPPRTQKKPRIRELCYDDV